MAERSLKPPPTLPTRLALGLALLGLLPSPEVVVPIVLVRRRRAPVRRVVALVEAPAAALARREVLGPRLLAAVADLCERLTNDQRLNAPCASPSCRSGSGRTASCLLSGVRLCVFRVRTCGRHPCCGCGSFYDDGLFLHFGRAAAAADISAPRRPEAAARAASAARRVAARRSGGTPCAARNSRSGTRGTASRRLVCPRAARRAARPGTEVVFGASVRPPRRRPCSARGSAFLSCVPSSRRWLSSRPFCCSLVLGSNAWAYAAASTIGALQLASRLLSAGARAPNVGLYWPRFAFLPRRGTS